MAATQSAFGSGPHGQHGPPGPNAPQPTNAPQHPPHGPYRSQPEDAHHHHHPRPLLFLQPTQPYYPYQWPVPMPYTPYCGFPGLGYGMIMPPFPPSPYMEAPGYIVPHTQLHLADYRRMINPHFPPAMAYHARRFRYQQNGAPRETISSEVQTEPPPVSGGDCVESARLTEPDSGRGSSCTNASSPSCIEKPDRPDAPVTPSRAATPKSAYIFQKEEVRIECSGTPAGLKIVRSHETTAESAPHASADLAQCDVWSVSSAEGVIPLYRSSVHERDVTQDAVQPMGNPEEQCVPSYPDILLVGGSPSHSSEMPPSLDGPDNVAKELFSDPVTGLTCESGMQGDTEAMEDSGATPTKSVHFKILRLPFEMQYLEDLRKLEESVWSVESLVPYIPSTEWMVQHGFVEPKKVTEKSVVEVPIETSSSHLEALPSLESSQEVTALQGRNQQESVSSMESLPPYLPSASWLADFGNVYYYSKLPPSVQEQLSIFSASTDPLTARKKMNKDSKGQYAVMAAPPKQKEEKHRRIRKPEGRGVLDLESCLSQPLSGGARTEGAQNCARCLTKGNVPASLNSKAPNVKRHKVSHPSPGDHRVQTCLTCRCGQGKAAKKRPSPDVLSQQSEDEEMEDEAVENRAHPVAPKPQGSVPTRAPDARKLPSSKRHSEMCSVAHCSKLREQNCSCEEPKRGPAHDTQRRSHSDAMKESNENVVSIPVADKWKTPERMCLTQKRQTEKSWKAAVLIPDKDSCENGARPRNGNKQKKLFAQSQERQHSKMSNKTGTSRAQKTDYSESIEGYYSRSNWTKGTHRRDTRY